MRIGLLGRSSLRFYGAHPWQLLLAVAGIALGVAVFVGIELANDSARRAFELSSTSVRGQTTHRLLPVSAPITESDYRELKRDRRFVASAPVIEAPARLELSGERTLDVALIGVDPVEEPSVRGVANGAINSAAALELLVEPRTILLPERIADRYRIGAGDELGLGLGLGIGTTTHRVVVAGTFTSTSDDARAVRTDISTAQEMLGIGSLSRIDLSLDDEAALELARNPPPGTVLVSALGGDRGLAEITRAFNTNLTALGLLALIVGMFLIYSTISFTIVQRWRSIAVLRALGLERRELLASLLGEALVIGTVGTLIGLVLGRELSAGLLQLVLRTLDDLYFRRALQSVASSNWIFVYSAALGVGGTLASALVPTLLASRRDIASESRGMLERSAHRLSRRFAWAALPTLAAAIAIIVISERGLWIAFVALFLVVAAGAMLVPMATQYLMRWLEPAVAKVSGLPGRMAVRGVTDSLSRTGVATAALAVAVATVMSIGLMISSFRTSLIEWIGTTVTADLYIDVEPDSAADAESALSALDGLPGIIGSSRTRTRRIATIDGEWTLRAAAPGPEGYGIDITSPEGITAETLLAGDPASADEASLLVAEPVAYRQGIGQGDRMMLPTGSGLTEFTVAGIYRDYNTAGAELVIALDRYRALWNDDSLTSIGVHLAPDADEADVVAAIRERLGADRRIRSTSMIEEISLLVFDRTFQITEVLRLLAGVVAFLGILSAVMALQLERERELAVLRSLGMSIREVFAQILAQTSLLGLTAGLAAIPLGTALAWLLVYVINRRSFGWTMDFIPSADVMLSGVAMAIVAAVLAGIYPAFVGARADPGLAWRDD